MNGSNPEKRTGEDIICSLPGDVSIVQEARKGPGTKACSVLEAQHSDIPDGSIGMDENTTPDFDECVIGEDGITRMRKGNLWSAFSMDSVGGDYQLLEYNGKTQFLALGEKLSYSKNEIDAGKVTLPSGKTIVLIQGRGPLVLDGISEFDEITSWSNCRLVYVVVDGVHKIYDNKNTLSIGELDPIQLSGKESFDDIKYEGVFYRASYGTFMFNHLFFGNLEVTNGGKKGYYGFAGNEYQRLEIEGETEFKEIDVRHQHTVDSTEVGIIDSTEDIEYYMSGLDKAVYDHRNPTGYYTRIPQTGIVETMEGSKYFYLCKESKYKYFSYYGQKVFQEIDVTEFKNKDHGKYRIPIAGTITTLEGKKFSFKKRMGMYFFTLQNI